MALIDKAALLNRIATEVHYDSERSLEMYAKLLNEINDAPDALVRCKDCTMWNKERQICDRFSFTWTAEHTKPNDYCCWGERKEDGETN